MRSFPSVFRSLAFARSLHDQSVRAIVAFFLIIFVSGLAFGGAPDNVGQWTLPKDWGGTAVHMTLMRGDWGPHRRVHSQLLWWGFIAPPYNELGLWAWNPKTDACGQSLTDNLTTLAVPVPPRNIFCAGNSGLPTGDLMILGGHENGITGLAEATIFQRATRTWAQTNVPMSQRRWYGTACELPSGKIAAVEGQQYSHMVLFSGLSSQDNLLSGSVDRLKLTAPGEWDLPVTQAQKPPDAAWPPARKDHSLAYGPYFGPTFLFGGVGSDNLPRNDVYVLSRDSVDLGITYRWDRPFPVITPNGPPPLRSLHAAVARNERPANPSASPPPGWFLAMYVFGGLNNASNPPLGDLWKFQWDPNLVPPSWKWINLTAAVPGGPPSARYGHTVVYDKNLDMAVFFGGRASATQFSDDGTVIWGLKFGSNGPSQWQQISVTGTGPSPRYLHAMVNDPNLAAYTLTGSNDLWRREFLFSGTDASGAKGDIWQLWINQAGTEARWEQVPASPDPAINQSPTARSRATMIYHDEDSRLVIFGGDPGSGGPDSYVWAATIVRNSAGVTTATWQRLVSYGHSLSGHAAIFENSPVRATVPDIYDPNAAPAPSWSRLGDKTAKELLNYPRMFNAPGGRLFMAGPMLNYEWKSYLLYPDTACSAVSCAWRPFPNTEDPDHFPGEPAVMYRPGYVMKCGGTVNDGPSTGITKRIGLDAFNDANTSWVASDNTMTPRISANLTMLPNGQVLVNGGVRSDGDQQQAVYGPEIWDPDAGTHGRWYSQTSGALPQPLAASQIIRNYHSTALLLPDARLICAGGDREYKVFNPTNWDQYYADIYCPPYLFDANGSPRTRPLLPGVQETIQYGQAFKVSSSDPIASAVLIRPGAVTHAFNEDQHFVPLTVVGPASGCAASEACPSCYALTPPTDPTYAPPGDYLLFFLNAQGTPSIAEWVRLGTGPASTYATCDLTAPSSVGNLVAQRSGTDIILSWTAPGDYSSGSGTNSLPATAYEIRYRPDASFGSNPTMNDFLDLGILVSNPPTPANANASQTFSVGGFDPQRAYYFRLISKDNAGSYRNWSAISNEAPAPASPAGGCPFADTWTASGWQVENSLLGRSLTGALALDSYRLKATPAGDGGRYKVRLRENEQESTTLDQVRLAYVDHAPDQRTWALGEKVVLGTWVPPYQATTSTGKDITSLVNGSGAGFFAGQPGDTVLIDLVKPGSAMTSGAAPGGGLDPFDDGDGGKGGAPPGGGRAVLGGDDLANRDAVLLGSTGILIQGRDASGLWSTIRQRYPREYNDEFLVDTLDQGPVRMVFVGSHRLNHVGRVVATGAVTPQPLNLLGAQHSRLGDVSTAVAGAGDATTALSPGDTLNLEFAATPVPAGQVRDFFLLSKGVYTSAVAPLANRPAPGAAAPTRFALLQNRPNPFTGGTTIGFELPRAEQVRIEVFDPQGRQVQTLADGSYAPGRWSVEWDHRDGAGRAMPPGIYLYRMRAGGFEARRKMALAP